MNLKEDTKNFYEDSEGIKFKYPERSCKLCVKYPCFRGIESCFTDMAKYGCHHYDDGRESTVRKTSSKKE